MSAAELHALQAWLASHPKLVCPACGGSCLPAGLLIEARTPLAASGGAEAVRWLLPVACPDCRHATVLDASTAAQGPGAAG